MCLCGNRSKIGTSHEKSKRNCVLSLKEILHFVPYLLEKFYSATSLLFWDGMQRYFAGKCVYIIFFDFNTRFYFFVIKYCFKSLPQIFILISDGPIEIFNRSLNTLDVIVFKLPCIKMCWSKVIITTKFVCSSFKMIWWPREENWIRWDPPVPMP